MQCWAPGHANDLPPRTTAKPSTCSIKQAATARTSPSISIASYPLKAKAEYDPDDVPRTTAAKAVGSARRAVIVARRVPPPELGTTPGS